MDPFLSKAPGAEDGCGARWRETGISGKMGLSRQIGGLMAFSGLVQSFLEHPGPKIIST